MKPCDINRGLNIQDERAPILLMYNCAATLGGVGGSFNNIVHNCFPSSALKAAPKVPKKTGCQSRDLLWRAIELITGHESVAVGM